MNELQDIDLKDLIERETGERFNRQGYIKCPFHIEKTPSLSVKFYPDKNKYKFKCFGCDEVGDAIDFITKLKGITYIEAREYLGLTVEKSIQEEQEEKIKSYIEWELSKFRIGQELLGIFTFTDKDNNPVYFKAKFKEADGKKSLSYYHLEGDKVINKRGVDEIPYNLYKVIQGVKDNKIIIICEGEKDANTINSMFKGHEYVATSIKGVKDLSIFENEKIYVCGDTGTAGEKYKWEVYKKLFSSSKSFKFINLPGIKNLGDNKDVTDWLEAGHTKEDLLNAFDRSLDLKSKYELQQGNGGIYKIAYKGRGDNVEEYKKTLTNFKIIEATRITFVDEDKEGIRLVLKSPTNKVIERIGEAIVFDDTRSFRNFLGTLDLSFKGGIDDLVEIKEWINKYFALEIEEVHQGVKFIKKDEDLLLVTSEGALKRDSVVRDIRASDTNGINIIDLESITKDELKEIKKHIFRFAAPDKTIPIIGTIINDLAVYQNETLKQKLHHLLIVGESGSGKSTILENVIAPILNYPKRNIQSIGLITPFALIKGLATGNYPLLFDEFKPSSLDPYKVKKISETFRNLYDRATISRGDKSFGTKDFQMSRPLILVGEESYPNQEKALIERSCIVYLAKRERSAEHTENMQWIIENENLLNKLGRSLIEIVLSLSTQDYKKIRQAAGNSFKNLSNRPLNTAVNIYCGIEILNMLLKQHKIPIIKGYIEHVEKNIQTEVLEEGNETYSIVERMLLLYNDMIEDGRTYKKEEDTVKYRGDGIFIKTSEMLNQINEHISRVNADIIPLGIKDFKKQAMKAGYLEKVADKLFKVSGKPIRFDTYNKEMLRKLKVNAIVPPELLDVTELEDNVIPFT